MILGSDGAMESDYLDVVVAGLDWSESWQQIGFLMVMPYVHPTPYRSHVIDPAEHAILLFMKLIIVISYVQPRSINTLLRSHDAASCTSDRQGSHTPGPQPSR